VTPQLWLLGILVAASAFGLWRKWSDGKTRSVSKQEIVTAKEVGHALGERATLLQFSSAFCAPCRQAKGVLGRTAEIVPGVTHIEIDAESHLELVRRLDIRRTPTTLVLDDRGRVHNRVSGVPRQEELFQVLAQSIGN